MRPGPPESVERGLVRILGETESSRFVQGDLREEYAAVRARRGRWLADVWYASVVMNVALGVHVERWREARQQARLNAMAGARRPRRGDTMGTELRHALRFLVRRPAFSAAVVLTVALAIAATTTAFAVVDGVLLKRLPWPGADRTVVVWERNVVRGRERNVASPANFLTWREQARSFAEVASAVGSSITRTGDGEPERMGAVDVTAAFFRIFEAKAVVGRLFTEEEDRAGGPNVVVLGENYWRRAYGGDAAVVGQSIILNGRPATILGVLSAESDVPVAAEFGGTGTHDVWTPSQFSEEASSFTGRYLQVFARLQPGVTLEQARQEMGALAARLREDFPQRQAGWDINVITMREQITGEIRTTLLVIFGAVCFVLLIACANVANLLLTRAVARQQEMSVRTALGAGRPRLLRQLLLESALLSTAGGVAGVGAAYWALRAVVLSAPDIPRIETLGLNGTAMGFALLATIGAAALFGVAPALHVVGGNVGGSLKTRETGGGQRGSGRLRSALIVTQFALCLVLLVGAGLLIRSFANRLDTGVGFDTTQLMTAEITLPGSSYDRGAQVRFFESLVERTQALPGVRAASAITFAPLAGGGSASSFWVTDRPIPAPGQFPVADMRWIHRDYHGALGVTILEGRGFDETDDSGAPRRVVINETGARLLWPGESALGKRVTTVWGDTLESEIIGIARDVLFNGPETERRTMLYWDHRQFRDFSQMTLIVRTAGDPTTVVPAIRAAVRQLDPNLPVFNVRPMDDLYGRALARPRFATISLALFAGVALLLAALGIYGVISHATQQREREFGIRLALGARPGDVIRLVMRQGLRLVGVAIVLGAGGALLLNRSLQGLVFQVSTTDPLTFGATIAVLAGIALLACGLPAWRASTIPPVEAIRRER